MTTAPPARGTSTGTLVLLVDGVGNAVLYLRQRDVSAICLQRSRTVFVRTEEVVDGVSVYRLRACGRPEIRHVNKHFGEPGDS